MNFIKKQKNKIIAVVFIAGILYAAWFFGGNYAKSSGSSDSPNPVDSSGSLKRELITTDEAANALTDKYKTDPVPDGKPLPVEPQDASVGNGEFTVTLSVRCDTILDNMKWLKKEKHELVPPDGVIFPATEVTAYEGESVFNVLQREMKHAKIHMEFMNTPIYNSAYIEAINNLYEFDVGELSGWLYSVNGWFPNYGCSRYHVKSGDVIEWFYTCDLGIDVKGADSVNGQVPTGGN